MDEAQRLGATPFDVKGVELGHHGKECSFEDIVKKYDLSGDPGSANYSWESPSSSLSTGLITPKSPWDSSPIPAVK